MELLNRERGWSRIAIKLHYPSKQVGATLKAHYERILYPFFVFKKGDIFDSDVSMMIKSEIICLIYWSH